MNLEDLEFVHISYLNVLHEWLEKNHGQKDSVWIITYKKPHPAYIPWQEIVAELLCWGWTDSVPHDLDEDRTRHLVSPRDPDSAWTGANKLLVAELRQAGRMQPAGDAAITIARENGMWEFLEDVERLDVPDDLANALGEHRVLWDSWSRSIRRVWLEKIKRAEKPETRDKRIAECADAVRKNLLNGGL